MRYRWFLALLVVASPLLLAASCFNLAPIAQFSATPMSGASPLAVSFDASASYDPDGSIVAYAWDYGDGTHGTGLTPSHTFTTATTKTFTVTLVVTDDGGRTGGATRSISVTGSGGMSGSVLFFDNFDSGRDPAWESDPCWTTYGGKYYRGCTGEGYTYVITGTNWSNYVVELDLDPVSSTAGVILRCQEDLRNMVVLFADYNHLQWGVKVDGNYEVWSESVSPGLFGGQQHLRVVADGTTYTVFVEDLKRLSFTDTHFASGMPGLYCGSLYSESNTKYDDFRVTALP